MAEKNITTWEELKTALTESITEDTTYNIKNDLDASNDILTERIKCICSGKNKIFKGNGYKINGITAYGNVTAIYSEQNIDYQFKFYDVKFTNFMVESGTFISLARISSNDELFINCFFNGVCKRFIPDTLETRGYSHFNKCSFNVRCEKFSGRNCYFDNCYIIITPLQNTNSFSSDSLVRNCYVEGTIKNAFSSSTYLTPNLADDNVFNCKVIITNYSDSTAYKVRRTGGNILINKDKLLQSDGVTPIKHVASATNTYFLTDEQIKNKDFIQQSTTFPLYG